ncbi:MAG: methionine--tRNA ligase [Candidatus Pacebacteria bacterium]|nr:methionine--tRNA ligase [Candidatus Paceibacterota bacterium]
MNPKYFYLTTTLPYVNADLHLGHALEFVRADVIARYRTLEGDHVFFNTGTDEHGMKIYEKAKELGKTPQEFVDESFKHFTDSVKMFGLLPNIHFIRTTNPDHESAAQHFWTLCYENGYIYKKNYSAKYCVGCEEVKTDSALVNGECPLHPGKPLQTIEEENYFFRYSSFTDKLTAFYEAHPDFVVPEFRYNEIKAFVARGLEDFSISRLKSKMPWGIPVPGDEEHVMYVWFDALTNYISTLGWHYAEKATKKVSEGDEGIVPINIVHEPLFENYWVHGTPTQYCGKDNLRFQAAMWQAMLMAAGVANSHRIVINGFVTGEGGVKMSKTLGNVVNPKDVVVEYGTDALRLFLVKELSTFEDSPFSMSRFKETYNADLANGLGNLLSRTFTMASSLGGTIKKYPSMPVSFEVHGLSMVERIEGMSILDHINTEVIPAYKKALDNFELGKAADTIWSLIALLDRTIARTEPFRHIKTEPEKAEAVLYDILAGIDAITDMLRPIMPSTAETIRQHLGTYTEKRPEAFTIMKFGAPLFPRKV